MARRLDELFASVSGQPALPLFRRFASEVETRFAPIEEAKADYEQAIASLKVAGLARIAEVIEPVLEEVLTRLRTATDIFEAEATGTHEYSAATFDTGTPGEGGAQLVFQIVEGRRNSFTTQGFVRLVPDDDPTLYVLASVDDYDWETGDLTVTVFGYADPPVPAETFSDWAVSSALVEGVQETVEGAGLAAAVAALTVEVAGKVATALLGAVNGVATLDSDGKLTSAQRFSVVGGGDLTSVAGVAGVDGNVPTAGLYTALGIGAAIASATGSLVPQTRQISTTGLLNGGGPLSGNLSLGIQKAGPEDFVKAAEDGKALTPKGVWDAVAPLAQDYAATLNIDLAVGRMNHIVAAVTGPMAIVLATASLVPGMNGWIKVTASGGNRAITFQTGSVAAALHGMVALAVTIPTGETWKLHYSVEVGGASPVIVWGFEKAIA